MVVNTRRAALGLLAAALVAGVASAADAQVMFVERAPPAALVEVVPPVPHPGWAWVQGHWAWRGHRWEWIRGHYVLGVVEAMPVPLVEAPPPAPGPRYFWVRGHYVWEGHHWAWHAGHWVL